MSRVDLPPVVVIYGASDDLIECEHVDANGRRIYHRDGVENEWECSGYKARVVCSDGTALRMRYGGSPQDFGIWRIEVMARGSAFIRHVVADASLPDGKQSPRGHTDIVELGRLDWVMCDTQARWEGS